LLLKEQGLDKTRKRKRTNQLAFRERPLSERTGVLDEGTPGGMGKGEKRFVTTDYEGENKGGPGWVLAGSRI